MRHGLEARATVTMKKIGIIGYGNTGQFLCKKILTDPKYTSEFDLAFVWNRSIEKLEVDKDIVHEKYWLRGAGVGEAFQNYIKNGGSVDMIVEVAHPNVVRDCGALFLEYADLYVASITALAEAETEHILRKKATTNGVYLPSGAAWGIHDVQKMNALGTLRGLSVTMRFNADALRLEERLKKKLDAYIQSDHQDELVLYKGNVRDLARLAPNNVNTMTCLALSGSHIGLDHTQGCLIAQKEHDAHIIDIEVEGLNGFKVHTRRHNPAKKGAVTGDETYNSFLISLLKAGGQGGGFHFC